MAVRYSHCVELMQAKISPENDSVEYELNEAHTSTLSALGELCARHKLHELYTSSL